MEQTERLKEYKDKAMKQSKNDPSRPYYVNKIYGRDSFWVTPIAGVLQNWVGYKDGELLFDKTVE